MSDGRVADTSQREDVRPAVDQGRDLTPASDQRADLGRDTSVPLDQGPADRGAEAPLPDADPSCECQSGPCCDGCHYHTFGDNHVCETVEELKCEDTGCGADALKRTGERTCQGFTADCTGDLVWGGWSTHEQCDSSSVCQSPDSSSAHCVVCDHGCNEGACWGDCDPITDACCRSDGTLCPHGCDASTNVCWPECDPTSDPCCDPDGTACDHGCDEAGTVYDPGTCWPLDCTTGSQCKSGKCVDGTCCDKVCTGTCRACDLPGSEGTCASYPAGQDPENECGDYTCNGATGCYSSCSCSGNDATCTSSACASDRYCNASTGKCVLKKNTGEACTAYHDDWECKSGHCVENADDTDTAVCCDAECDSLCKECKSTGHCVNLPAGTGPKIFYGCGGNSCNGNGYCYSACPNTTTDHCSTMCNEHYWCWEGECVADLGGGGACVAACQCGSGTCFPFVCW